MWHNPPVWDDLSKPLLIPSSDLVEEWLNSRSETYLYEEKGQELEFPSKFAYLQLDLRLLSFLMEWILGAFPHNIELCIVFWGPTFIYGSALTLRNNP